MTSVLFRSFGQTETGYVRYKNEDAFLISDKEGIYCVADGLGGHRGGEVASHLAVNLFRNKLNDLRQNGEKWIINQFTNILETANKEILKYGLNHPVVAGMGTTFSGLVIENEELGWVVHTGDSRIYGFSQSKKLTQLTTDHTLAMEQVKKGVVTEEEAERHPYWNILTSCLGGEQLIPEVIAVDLDDYHSFLLCSDGLTNMLSFEEVETCIKTQWKTPETLGNQLVEQALEQGGIDNITVVIVSKLKRNVSD